MAKDEHGNCCCRVCQDTRRWFAALKPHTDEAAAAFDEIMNRLAAAETDATYYRMKFKGTWPELPDNGS
jgi:hypothetical protein